MHISLLTINGYLHLAVVRDIQIICLVYNTNEVRVTDLLQLKFATILSNPTPQHLIKDVLYMGGT